jgi:hypothetical protein
MKEFYYRVEWGVLRDGPQILMATAAIALVFVLVKGIVLGLFKWTSLKGSFGWALLATVVSYLPALVITSLAGWYLGWKKAPGPVLDTAVPAIACAVCTLVEWRVLRRHPRALVAASAANVASFGAMMAVFFSIHGW